MVCISRKPFVYPRSVLSGTELDVARWMGQTLRKMTVYVLVVTETHCWEPTIMARWCRWHTVFHGLYSLLWPVLTRSTPFIINRKFVVEIPLLKVFPKIVFIFELYSFEYRHVPPLRFLLEDRFQLIQAVVLFMMLEKN